MLSVAEKLFQIQLRHSCSEPDDETGPGSADPGTAELLRIVGLSSSWVRTDVSTPVLWRAAPEEARPLAEQGFLAQVDMAVTDIPDDIGDQIKSTYEAHDV